MHRHWGHRVLAATAVALFTTLVGAEMSGVSPRFFDDDPLWVVPDSQDASGMQPLEIGLTYDVLSNSFGRPGDSAANVRARNLNTVDEVPDSSWFTNRLGRRPLTPELVAKGPDVSDGPAPGPLIVTSAKSDGVTPGFTARDSSGTVWFVKFDPPGYRAMATGTEVVVTKLMWALGYRVPENHIATFRASQLTVGEGARITPFGEGARDLTADDIRKLLAGVDREPDETYRIVASKALEGKPIGRIQFFGTRPDDPNDIVPHEHRRELRAYGVFAAWLNHVDAKAINSRDMLITANGKSFVRHNLIDFGAALGSGSIMPHERWEGSESLLETKGAGIGIVSLGFVMPAWRTADFYEARSIGRLLKDNTTFDPNAWRPRVPNPAFLRARADDRFWAAAKLMLVSDAMIRAAVATGRFDDEKAEAFLAQALIDRRNAIVRAYLPAVNPIVSPALDANGVLTFDNAAVLAAGADAPERYSAMWSRFDNSTSLAQAIGETSGAAPRLTPPNGLPAAAGSFIKVEIRAESRQYPSWKMPVHAYFTRTGGAWRLVGFERMPDAS